MKNHLITHFTAALLCFTALPLFGASVTWNNSGTNFNTGANWGDGSDPLLPLTTDNATFTGAADKQPDLSADRTIQGLTFSGTDASGYNLTSSSGSLTLTNVSTGANSAIYSLNTSGTNTISAPIILGGADKSTAYFYQAAGATLISTLEISGNISSTGTNVKLSLSGGVQARAVITLSGSNSYSGGTTVANNVKLYLGHASAVGSGTLSFVSGYFDNTSGDAMTLTHNNDMQIGASSYFVGSDDMSLGTGKLIVTGASPLFGVLGASSVFTVASIAGTGISSQLFTKYSSGTLAITGAAQANFNGVFKLWGGTVLIGDKDSLGYGDFTAFGGTLSASTNLSGTNAVANDGTLAGGLTLSGSNNLTLSGTITQIGANRTLTASNTGATVLSGPLFLSGTDTIGRTLTIAGAQALTISGAIADYAGSGIAGNLIVSNTNKVALSGLTSSYTGSTSVTVANAILEVSKLADGGANSSIGASSNAATNLSLSNSTTLRYVGSGDDTDRLFKIAGTSNSHGITLDASGSGAIQFTNTGNLDYGSNNQTRTLTLAGTNTDNNSLAFALKNNGTAALSMVKNGVGTWVLSGSNTYTGTTLVNAGTLLIQGEQTGTGLVTVKSDAALGGQGTIAGSLSLLDGAKFVFSLTDPLTVNGPSVTFGAGKFGIIDLIGLNASTAAGEYILIDGMATIGFGNLNNYGEINAYDFGGGKSAYFKEGTLDWEVVVVPEPTTWALLAGGLTVSLVFRRRRRA